MEATGGDVAFLLQIDETEVISQRCSAFIDSLLYVADVGVHVSCQGQNLENQFGCLFFERVLDRYMGTGTLCSGRLSICSLSCLESGLKIRLNSWSLNLSCYLA